MPARTSDVTLTATDGNGATREARVSAKTATAVRAAIDAGATIIINTNPNYHGTGRFNRTERLASTGKARARAGRHVIWACYLPPLPYA